MTSSHLPTLAIFTVVLSLAAVPGLCASENTTKEFLDIHNAARAQVGVPPLVWSRTLAAYASQFAAKVRRSCDNTLRSHGPYGENVAAGYSAFTVNEAANEWVAQRPHYNHRTNSCARGQGQCKEYTQVVWRKTARVGCASIVCGAGWPFVVCEYDPPGNSPGQKPY